MLPINKKNKQILILDEPEQGLDEENRKLIMNNILNDANIPVLCIYHGNESDIIKFPFTKVWEFEEVNKVSIVKETDFPSYRNKLITKLKEYYK